MDNFCKLFANPTFAKNVTLVKVGNTVKMGKSGTLLLYTRKLGTRKMICAKKTRSKGFPHRDKKVVGETSFRV